MKKEYKIKETVKHQKIGGKIFYPIKELTFEEVDFKGMRDGNIACINFLLRRSDYEKLTYKRLFYGKVKQKDSYLGYIVCEDELEGM